MGKARKKPAKSKAKVTKKVKKKKTKKTKCNVTKKSKSKPKKATSRVVEEAQKPVPSKVEGKDAPQHSTAEEMASRQREISVAEFFTKNRHLLGFDNPRKALLTTIK